MILGRDLITSLVLDLRIFKNVVIGGEGSYEGFLATMVDVSNYEFKTLTDRMVKPGESSINAYVIE